MSSREFRQQGGAAPGQAVAGSPGLEAVSETNTGQAAIAEMVRESRGMDVELSDEEREARRRLIEFLGPERGQAAVDKILGAVDKNDNGSVSVKEFKRFMKLLGYGGLRRAMFGGAAFGFVQQSVGEAKDEDAELTGDHLMALLSRYGLD